MTTLPSDVLLRAARLLGSALGRVAAADLFSALTSTEEERIDLRAALAVLGWRRAGSSYVRGPAPLVRLAIRAGCLVPVTPTLSDDLTTALASTLGVLHGTITAPDAYRAAALADPLTPALARRISASMRRLGFERVRSRVDGRIRPVYVRGRSIADRRRPIYVFRYLVSGDVVATHDPSPSHPSRPPTRRYHQQPHPDTYDPLTLE